MRKRADDRLRVLMALLCADPAARLTDDGADRYTARSADGQAIDISRTVLRALVARGLVEEAEPGRFAAAAPAHHWLKRQSAQEVGFRAQHGSVSEAQIDGRKVRMELDESPVAALARRRGKSDEPWLAPHHVAAAERVRRDFEIGRLQPRITANWSASVSTGRRAGDGSEIAGLTDMALAARRRFEAAASAVGPEFSGVLIDVCCFLKGLETVERERRWPARSAKLVLRLALESLARHYGLAEAAVGASSRMRNWGAADYRPSIS